MKNYRTYRKVCGQVDQWWINTACSSYLKFLCYEFCMDSIIIVIPFQCILCTNSGGSKEKVSKQTNTGHLLSKTLKISNLSPNECTDFRLMLYMPLLLTLKVLNFWKFTGYCSLKPLWSGVGEVVPAHTSPTLHPPSPQTMHQLSWLALEELMKVMFPTPISMIIFLLPGL